MNVAQIVGAACRQLGFSPDADELTDGMEALNLLLQEWSNGNGIYRATRESFNCVSGTASYAIGTGQTWDSTRPTRIIAAFCRDSGGSTDYPINAYHGAADYAALGLKSTPGRPDRLYYEPSYPYGSILLYPTPDAAYAVHLYSHKPFAAYTATDDDLALPPEFEPALKFNLAVELAEEFGKQISPVTATRAQQTLDALKRLHAHPVPQLAVNPFHHDTKFDMTSGGYL